MQGTTQSASIASPLQFTKQCAAPSKTLYSRPFSVVRLLRFAVIVAIAEAVAMLLNAQSYKLSGVSLVWLPNGLVLGSLLRSQKRCWPALLIIGHVIDIVFNLGSGGSVGTSCAYASFNTIEILVAASLLYGPMSGDPDLTQMKQLRAFFLFGVLLAPLCAALSASIFLYFHDGEAFSNSARFWFAADMLGIATVTPLYLSYQTGKQLSSRSPLETFALFSILTTVVTFVFGFNTYPSLWLVLLALMVVGVRAGFTASALGLLIVISIGGYLSIVGRGPLGSSLHQSLADRTLFFQLFVAISTGGLYITEGVMTANRKAKAGLVESEARYRSLADELEGRVVERTLELQKEIAEREAVQEHLIQAKVLAEESNRTKSIFLANMSHELRTPLNAILGYSELLQEDADERGDKSAVSDLGRVQTAGRHLLTIINDVLDLSKIESGRIELNLESTTVTRIVDDVAATISPLARKQNNTFKVLLSDPAALVHVDVVKFRQCLMNLLSNACKFTESGSITLEVLVDRHPEGDATRWIVKDTGIGIEEKDLKRLFHAFSQVDSSATRRRDGTGLGLVISRRLVNMMDGDITLETELGRGSTFTIHMPPVQHAERAGEAILASGADS